MEQILLCICIFFPSNHIWAISHEVLSHPLLKSLRKMINDQFILTRLNCTLGLSGIVIVRFWSFRFQLYDFGPPGISIARIWFPGFQLHNFDPPDFMIVYPQSSQLL